MKAWLKKNKVTVLPGYGDPEFTRMQIERMRRYSDASIALKAAMLKTGIIP